MCLHWANAKKISKKLHDLVAQSVKNWTGKTKVAGSTSTAVKQLFSSPGVDTQSNNSKNRQAFITGVIQKRVLISNRIFHRQAFFRLEGKSL